MKLLGHILSFILLLFMYYSTTDNYDEDISYIGKRVVVETDTLTIVDFSLFEGNYVLSNDLKVHHNYVETYCINK